MARVRVSKAAHADLRGMGRYTRVQWGRDQSRRYLAALQACFERIATMPQLGRPCPTIRHDLWRIEHASHVVFFRQDASGILVSRVLHKRQLPAEHVFEDEGDG